MHESRAEKETTHCETRKSFKSTKTLHNPEPDYTRPPLEISPEIRQ